MPRLRTTNAVFLVVLLAALGALLLVALAARAPAAAPAPGVVIEGATVWLAGVFAALHVAKLRAEDRGD